MSNWISHLIIVDKLFTMGIDLDERGFAVGNIAPDCNVENEDWTQFTPPREITHWMNGESKLTADYEGFFEKHIKNKMFTSNEHKAFLWGYYSHLITDVEMQKFVRDDERVKNTYHRIRQNNDMYKQVKGLPEDFDTLKKIFGRNNIFLDIITQEVDYLRRNPNSRYNTIIKKIDNFPDYIEYFPQGAIVRKIGIMAREDMFMEKREEYIFFTQDEFNVFCEKTSGMIYNLIQEKIAQTAIK